MDDAELVTLGAATSADAVIATMALAAGASIDSRVVAVDEVALENLDEQNNFAFEVWTRFLLEDEEGQQSVAHHPGRLDELIPRTVRSHSRVEIHDDLTTA